MSTVEVARVYRFDGHHSLPDVPGYEHDHKHAYRVEVVLAPTQFVNTDGLDSHWEAIRPPADLNDFCDPSTVEVIASFIATAIEEGGFEVVQVTVWEDETRWGRWRRD